MLDFFAGSGTTAHAVMNANAGDGGKRRLILVQIPETTVKPAEAAKAGLSDDRGHGKGAHPPCRCEASKRTNAGLRSRDLDIGFRVLKVDTSNMADVYYAPDAIETG